MKIFNYLLLSIICLAHYSSASAVVFYVAPDGNDKWSGTVQFANGTRSDGPFKTLQHAQRVARKKAKAASQPTSINIAGGTYHLNHPLKFDKRDSGSANNAIQWQGEPGTTVAISGGKPLQNCTIKSDKIWVCPVDGFKLGKLKLLSKYRIKGGDVPGFELFVDGERMHLARWPNQDWAHIKMPLGKGSRFTAFEPVPFNENDFNKDDLKKMQVNIWSMDWYDEFVGVKSISENNEITLTKNTVFSLQSGRRYYLQNFKSGLDAPGEWYYDQKNEEVLFIPPQGSPHPENIEISTQKNLVAIYGAKNMQFRNLTFQSAAQSAIVVNKSNNMEFDALEIKNCGTKAIEINGGGNVTVSNGYFHHLGQGGIIASGGDTKLLQPANHIVSNNRFAYFANNIKNYSAAVLVKGVGITVKHNLIEHGPSNGILLAGNDHIIEKNELHHLCEEASDCGAIYSGRNWSYRGNVIRFNNLHNIFGYGLQQVDIDKGIIKYGSPNGARGVYLDDGVSGFEVFGNIFNNAGSMSLQIGGGRDNVVENNVFITDATAIWIDNRFLGFDWDKNRKLLKQSPYKNRIWQARYPELTKPMASDTWPEGNRIQHNVILATKPNIASLKYKIPVKSTIIGDNLVWNSRGQFKVDYLLIDNQEKKGVVNWGEWMVTGIEQNSINDDPCLTYENNHLAFCVDSPVNLIGFESIADDIGLI